MAQKTVSSGQSSGSQTVGSGELLFVAYGGIASHDLVQGGGLEIVAGSAIDETVSGVAVSGHAARQVAQPAALTVASAGVTSGLTVLDGAALTVASGGAVFGAAVSGNAVVVLNGNALSVAASAIVEAGGILHDIAVASGGVAAIYGTASGGIAVSGGIITAEPGAQAGRLIGVSAGPGGFVDIGFGVASGTVLSGGSASVGGISAMLQGEALATTILSGGVLHVGAYGLDSGTFIGSAGLEVVDPEATSLAPTIGGGTLELTAAVVYHGIPPLDAPLSDAQITGPIVFSGGGGTLIADGGPCDIGPVAPSSVISGFDVSDRIYLPGVPADPDAVLTVSGDIATVSAGGQAYVLDIVGASSLGLTLGIGTQDGTIDIGIACFCTGTAILTPAGERPVESIVPGDLVLTTEGDAEAVVWVGRRSYAGRFLAGQPHLLPVRIGAGALGGGLPRRDLRVSPNHALLLDGVLIPAGVLVGCPGVGVERGCAEVEYVHLELAAHAVVFAEGAPAETFLDDDSRGLFHTRAGVPGAASGWCAPRACDGAAVEAVRKRLVRRAA